MSKNRARFQDGNRSPNGDQDDDGCRNCHRCNRMDGDAQRAVVCIAVQGVDVRHLDNCQQSQQNEAHDRGDYETSRSPASSPLFCACGQHHPLTLGYTHDSMPVVVDRLRLGRRKPTLESIPTERMILRLNLEKALMNHLRNLPLLLRAALCCLFLATSVATAQTHTPLRTKPDAANTTSNHRLVLKDGTYQIVRKYVIVGDRVRYISLERGGDWEEMPESLVDWEATRKWERDHAEETGSSDQGSPAMKEAQDIDKEEAAERAEEAARMPEVAKGLELPDQDSVFVLDTYQGTPELVELAPNALAVDTKTHHGLSTLNPLAGQRASIELPGAHAKVHLHVNDPAIFISLNATDNGEKVLSHAMTVDTRGAPDAVNRKHGAHSPESGFAIVKVDERKALRIVGAIHISPTGNISQSEDTIPMKVVVMPGKHWLKLTPTEALAIGEYALVEILSPSDISQSVWDFQVNPRLGDNQGALTPILKQ